jgi:serine/threonine-protein kinase
VKPANVFLCRQRSEPDTVKVLDFGLVKELAAQDPALSAVDAVLGTPLYMAPEAITAPERVDARSDLYSLGAIAYLLVTGTPVFSGTTAMEICAKHLHAAPESPSARLGRPVPADLEQIVLACLAKPPEARPESAEALRARLDACASAGTWRANDADAWWAKHGAEVDARRASSRSVSGTAATVQVDRSRNDGMLAPS